MLTLKLNIKSVSDNKLLEQYIFQYTGLFYKLYNNFELSADKNFKKTLLTQFNLFDISMIDFCIADVKMVLERNNINLEKNKNSIAEISKLIDNNIYSTKKDKRTKFKLIKKRASLIRNLNKQICFGGKNLLRKITKAKQENKEELYIKYLTEFKLKRKLGVYLVGRACEKGNRKVEFNLNNNQIVFSPNSKTHIEISFFSSKNQNKILFKLNEMANGSLLPVTVRISNNYLYLVYDEEKVAGFAFDQSGYKKYILEHDVKTKEKRKEIYKKFITEQEERKTKGKYKFRFAAIDINPYEIGLVIGDKIGEDGENKIIHSTFFCLKNLSKQLNISSHNNSKIYQNNKRKHELKQVWKEIFQLIKHYKCAYLSVEDLNFKQNHINTNGKEANYQTRNIWHRELTKNLITKYCNILGTIKIEVNPVYSSFIGNLVHTDYDCISAARELLRRGITKYKKGSSLYPSLTRINQEKLNYLLGENIENEGSTIKSWNELYKLVSLSGKRYRNKDKNLYTDNDMQSIKSKILVYGQQPTLYI